MPMYQACRSDYDAVSSDDEVRIESTINKQADNQIGALDLSPRLMLRRCVIDGEAVQCKSNTVEDLY